LAVVLCAGSVEAADINVLSAAAMRTVMADIGPKFERATGHTLIITFVTVGEAVKRVQGGEAYDVVLVPRQGITPLLKSGKTSVENVTEIARSGIGIAVRKGAKKPDISSPDALKRALLAAKSITYANPQGGGAAGIHFARVLERLGIAEEMKTKTVFHPKPDATGTLIANGDAELGINQMQVLVPVPGIDIVGPLPADLQDNIVFASAVMRDANDVGASKALVAFMRTPASAAVMKAQGMEPTPVDRVE
jgi:molybdate transport system substrate-binding protein